ncbi:MAG: alpha/beta hydrolase [Bryobacteraceae bacterium]
MRVTPTLVAGLSLTAAAMLPLDSCAKATPSAIERLHACEIEEGPADAYCGKLAVWENRESKTGRKINLKIVIMPALSRKSSADPLFLFAGGPGQGAAKIAKNMGGAFRLVQDTRDLVFIDQRGTGDSNPLDCKGDEHDADDLNKALRLEVPLEVFRDCLKKYDADPRLYTTPVAMDDIDEVRRHLGYGQINLWGGSYGTRAALVFLRRHEDAVRSVILDGVAPPDMRLPLWFARDGQRSLDLTLDACTADPGCARRFPDLRGKVKQVLERLERKPRLKLTHPRTGETAEATVSREAIALVIMGALYAPATASLLPRLIEDAAGGNFEGLLALAFMGEASSDTGMSQGMFLSVACAEDMPRIQPADVAASAAGTFLGDAMFRTRMKACEFWPVGKVPPEYYQPVVSDKPTLVLSGRLDPVTPPAWGEGVAKHLSNSRHIVVPGAGHGASSAGCVPKLIRQFLEDGSAKSLDAACVEHVHRPPFFVTYSGPEAGPVPEARK